MLPADGVPRIDLDSDDNSGATGADYAEPFYIGRAAVAIADTDTAISDSDSTTLESASITLTNAAAGDTLTAGVMPAGITVAGSATALILTGTASLADYEAAIKGITFENLLAAPALGNRAIEIVVNDGTTDSPTATATITVKPPVIDFLVVGDGPYNSDEIQPFYDILADAPLDYQFVIHLADIKSGASVKDPTVYFPMIADVLQASPIPLFIVLGDNEYNDMPDPEASFSVWKDNFLFFDQNWNHDIPTMYQDIRLENFSFVIENTLFIGLDMPAGPVHDAAQYAARSADNLAWIEDMFGQFGTTVNNAVLFGQDSPSYSAYKEFKAGFIAVGQEFQKPILYLQGDDHAWKISNPYSEAPNITKVVIDRTGPNPPLHVTVAEDLDDPFSSDRDFDGIFL